MIIIAVLEPLLDLYSDYLLCSTKQTSATGLSAMSEGAVSHDKVTRFLSGEDFRFEEVMAGNQALIRQYESAEACLVFDDAIPLSRNHTWVRMS